MKGRFVRPGVALACAWAPMAGPGCGPAPRLRVATWNIAHGRGLAFSQIGLPRETFEANLRAIAGALRHERPDVVCLQEADGRSGWSGGFDHVAFLAEAAGYPYLYHGIHATREMPGLTLRYGTALLSRRPLTDVESHAFRVGPLDTKGYALASVDFDGRKLTVVSVHLDFKAAAYRRRQAAALIERLRARGGPVIVAGDFNCTWQEEDDALRLIAARLGLRAYDPEQTGEPTFPADQPGSRIDWILASEDLRFVAYRRLPELLSDHLGMVATLAWD